VGYFCNFLKSARRKQSPKRRKLAQTAPNPTTSIYNTTGSLARFENKNILFYFEKRSSLLQRWRCGCKFKSRRIGSWSPELAPSPFKKLSLDHQCGRYQTNTIHTNFFKQMCIRERLLVLQYRRYVHIKHINVVIVRLSREPSFSDRNSD
jgi:hypothetical protein